MVDPSPLDATNETFPTRPAPLSGSTAGSILARNGKAVIDDVRRAQPGDGLYRSRSAVPGADPWTFSGSLGRRKPSRCPYGVLRPGPIELSTVHPRDHYCWRTGAELHGPQRSSRRLSWSAVARRLRIPRRRVLACGTRQGSHDWCGERATSALNGAPITSPITLVGPPPDRGRLREWWLGRRSTSRPHSRIRGTA